MLKNQTVELLPARTTMRQHKSAGGSSGVTVNVLIVARQLIVVENSTVLFRL
jgi:hypothetical protein